MATNGWTGGHYSLWRAIFGAYLIVSFAILLWRGAGLFSPGLGEPYDALRRFPSPLALADSPLAIALYLATGVVGAVYLTLGRHDRWAAGLLLYLGICLVARNPAFAIPGDALIGGLLVAHLFVAAAPYGSWAARGRVDPAGDWNMNPLIHLAAWVILVLTYALTGWTRLALMQDTLPWSVTVGVAALELAFLPLVFVGALRPWMWLLLLAVELALVPTGGNLLGAGVVFLHLFTFDPAWIRPIRVRDGEILFYDGTCGLCHRAVRFLLAEDRSESLRFAPLEGGTFRALVPEAERSGLPDSIVFRAGEGRLLVRSAAVLDAMKRLGGAWRAIAAVSGIAPAWLPDRVYDVIAAVRCRLFARPAEACPLIPSRLAGRFEP